MNVFDTKGHTGVNRARAALGIALFFCLMLAGGLAGSPGAAAQEANASIEVHSRLCPAGTTDDFYNLCHDAILTGVGFELTGADPRSGSTDNSGNLLFSQLPAGSYSLSGGIPAEGYTLYSYCSSDLQDGVDASAIELGEGEALVCDMYAIAPEGPETVTTSVTVAIYNCLPGATPESVGGEACSAAEGDFEVIIGSMEGIFEPLTLADASFDGTFNYTWSLGTQWPDTSSGWYIAETELPAGFTSYMAVGGSNVTFNPDGLNGTGTYLFETSWETPNPYIAIYNFQPDTETPVTPVATATATATTTVTTLPSTGSGDTASDNGSFLLIVTLLIGATAGTAIVVTARMRHQA